MKKVLTPIVPGNPDIEIKEIPIVKSIELYLSKIEMMTKEERILFSQIFKSLSLPIYVIMKK